ncbi:MAG: NAD(+) diphosphatase [Bacteroidales bacterium]|nr:NAD(+) diphosphatase [Bacteroidales bacterium]
MKSKYLCLFVGRGQMVVKTSADAPALPTLDELADSLPAGTKTITVHTGEADIEAAHLPQWQSANPEFSAEDFRPLFLTMPHPAFAAACKAKQMVFWDEQSRFCPECGSPLQPLTDISKKCPECGHETYPPISPAIIVRVERGQDEILMVRARNFRDDHYGLVAGFVEVGESLEECVRREVREETGLEITDIKYWGSQPWPFPSGLMVGFVAQYAGGQIKIQQEELIDARFFRRGQLPALPGKMSIARQLIDEWTGQP